MLGIQLGFKLTALCQRHTLYEMGHTDSPHYTVSVTSGVSTVTLPASNTATASLRGGEVPFSFTARKQRKWILKYIGLRTLHSDNSSTGTGILKKKKIHVQLCGFEKSFFHVFCNVLVQGFVTELSRPGNVVLDFCPNNLAIYCTIWNFLVLEAKFCLGILELSAKLWYQNMFKIRKLWNIN